MIVILTASILLFLAYAALIFYYRRSWLSIPGYDPPAGELPSTYISVIIPARNEEKNIERCLQSVLGQFYPKELFEIIVVDDHSTDQTAAIVRSYERTNIRLISLKDHVDAPINSFKKKAIEVAVSKASGNLIVTTDADCIVPVNWLHTIASFYETKQAKFIAAPVLINNGSSFIEIFQSLDFMTLQGITGAAVFKKLHSMCNGANLAYEKKAFEEVNGFSGIDTIASGDDMLLMHKIYQKYPEQVFFLRSREAIVVTAPVKTIAAFFNQRIRWASKAGKYDDKTMLPVLVLVYFFNLLMLLLPIASIISGTQYTMLNIRYSSMELWIALIGLKIIVELLFLIPVAGFFGKQKLLLLFPLMQPFHILYTVMAGFLGRFGTYKWKERKVK